MGCGRVDGLFVGFMLPELLDIVDCRFNGVGCNSLICVVGRVVAVVWN